MKWKNYCLLDKIMVRRKTDQSPIFHGNKTLACYVSLENNDFLKYSVKPARKGYQNKQITEKSKPLVKLLDNHLKDQDTVNNNNVEFPSVRNQPSNQKLTTPNSNVMEPKNKLVPLESTDKSGGRYEGTTLGSVCDPKFGYKCSVILENCDFSKYSKGKHGSYQKTNNKQSLKIADRPRNKEDKLDSKNQQTLQSKKIIKTTSSNEMQHRDKVVTVKSTDIIDNSYDAISPLIGKKELRARKKVNYKEKKSIGTPDTSKIISSEGSNRIPIYKKIDFDSPKCRKRKGDLYDFFAESDDDKDSDVSFRINLPAKKKKYNHHVQINDKITSKRLNVVRTKKDIGNEKYEDKINKIMNKFADKIKTKKGSTKPIQMNTAFGNQGEKQDQIESKIKGAVDSVFNSTMLPESHKITFLDESVIDKSKELRINITGSGRSNNTKNVCIPSSENSSLNTGHDSYSDLSSFEYFEDVTSQDDNVENLFGFTDEVEKDGNDGASNRINIIQDVVLNGTPMSEKYKSTPKRCREKKSWRFDLKTVNRNPHFIAVKKNSLPSLNQEPILDHTFEERINVSNTITSLPSNKKSPKQQSILSYVEGAKENAGNHNFSRSLYDIDEFSPIKDKTEDKENSLEKQNISSESQKAKRNILGVLNDTNKSNIEASINNKTVAVQTTDNSSDKKKASKEFENFSFDTISEVIVEEEPRRGNEKPFRIEFTYQKCKKPTEFANKMTKPVRDSEVKRIIEEDPGFDEVVKEGGLDCGNLGLFEDPEETLKPTNSNTKLHTKKKINKDTDKNKAPQAKLSKEALKWIKQFNEMCDEVEHEQLEIE